SCHLYIRSASPPVPAVRRYKHFAKGKILPQAEFISAEEIQIIKGLPGKPTALLGNGLAVVNVGDNTEISDVFLFYHRVTSLSDLTAPGSWPARRWCGTPGPHSG